ncbi:hypothetical protein DPMN_045434 [Dreissena polymorpha]|uniref:Uncharacterized protein n=1 Tax=Dreissena polymorpha TaxID=45954 RepID=A0A9D4I1E0_DREPO|nr:hypothetical protein DPMN_045434 [Dreissena polymorpha]
MERWIQQASITFLFRAVACYKKTSTAQAVVRTSPDVMVANINFGVQCAEDDQVARLKEKMPRAELLSESLLYKALRKHR